MTPEGLRRLMRSPSWRGWFLAAVFFAPAPALVAPAGAGEPVFGTSQNFVSLTGVDSARIVYLGSNWTYRMLSPLGQSWRFDGDRAVKGTCGAGMQVVFTLTAAPHGTLFSSMPANISAWTDSVARIVERYDGDGYRDMPGLTCPVHYWHREEEDTFWHDTIDHYLAFLALTRAVILSVDPTAQVVTMGLSSDPAWSAACYAGFVKTRPPHGLMPLESLTYYSVGARRILAEGSYDIVDVHSYEVQPIIRGKMAWIRSLMADPTKPIWCFEGGGPYETRNEGYTDTLNAVQVVCGFTEAFANGVARYSQLFIPASPGRWDYYEAAINSALIRRVDDSTYAAKPGYATYRLLTQTLAGWTSAADVSVRDAADETGNLYDMRFQTPRGPVDVVWSPSGARSIRIPANTPYVKITHIVTAAGVTAASAKVEYVSVSKGLATLTAVPEPFFAEGSTTMFPAGSSGGELRAEPAFDLRLTPLPARDLVRFSWIRGGTTGTPRVLILSATGQTVRSRLAATGSVKDATELVWDLTDDAGRAVPSGVYFAAVAIAPGSRTIRRIPVVR